VTIADWLIVLTVLASVVIGLVRGFVVEVMALVVWAVALLASALLAPRLTDALASSIETPSGRIFLAYA
jgi:membrane protein required for colicin V production